MSHGYPRPRPMIFIPSVKPERAYRNAASGLEGARANNGDDETGGLGAALMVLCGIREEHEDCVDVLPRIDPPRLDLPGVPIEVDIPAPVEEPVPLPAPRPSEPVPA